MPKFDIRGKIPDDGQKMGLLEVGMQNSVVWSL
jgi:hypothetical protein